MLTGLILALLGALSLWWSLARPRQFARRRAHDRAMPWMFSGEPSAWTRKAFAALPLNAERGVYIALSVLMIAGGIAYVVLR
jgi:hypothetical protein